MTKKKLQALIMAAGYGTRLEPLTIAVPKPMIPIINTPCMEHNVNLLKTFGFCDITANIHYHPEQIQNYFGNGQDFGVNLAYSFEEELLGTAGGVRKMAVDIANIQDTFVVLSSDALTDINLDKLLEFHRQKKALVTIGLRSVKDVSQFGVVLQNDDQRVTGFQEKPDPKEAKSNLVNTGIYVFEPEILKLIPEGFYDFGKQLFPQLVAKAAPVYGFPMIGYWSDVGCLDQYIEANHDAMKGSVCIEIPGKKASKSTWLGKNGRISDSARFEGSVIIGDNCKIEPDVYIKDSVIGDKSTIKSGTVITGSIIWADSVIESEANINQAVLGSWCHVGSKAKVKAGSVIANRSVIRANTEVKERSRLKPNTIL